MPVTRSFLIFLMGLLACTAAPQLHAQKQGQQPSIVRVSGEANVSISPSRLRLTFPINRSAADAKSAIQALQKHQKTIEEELGKYSSKPTSIQFKQTQLVSSVQGMAQPQIDDPFGEPMLFGPPDTQAEEDEVKTMLYTASCSIAAEWNLKSNDPTTLYLDSLELKKYLQDRKLIASAGLESNTGYPMQMAQSDILFNAPSSMSYTVIGGLESCTITYVGVWSRDQENSTMKSAFEDAKSKAKLLAESADKKLGRVSKLQRSSMNAPNSFVPAYYFGQVAYRQYYADGFDYTLESKPSNDREVESSQPDGLSKSIQLDVEFEIE